VLKLKPARGSTLVADLVFFAVKHVDSFSFYVQRSANSATSSPEPGSRTGPEVDVWKSNAVSPLFAVITTSRVTIHVPERAKAILVVPVKRDVLCLNAAVAGVPVVDKRVVSSCRACARSYSPASKPVAVDGGHDRFAAVRARKSHKVVHAGPVVTEVVVPSGT